MEPLLETISLDLEESNELLFRVKIEGTEPSPAKVRLVCESGDLAYMFNGYPTQEEGVVQFLLPVLKDKISEGMYLSRVEVLIENRYFAPVNFNIDFKQAVKVVAEAIQMPQRRPTPQTTVTASPIVVKRPVVPTPQVQHVARPLIVAPPPQRPTPAPVVHKQPPVPSPMTLRERYNRVEKVEEEVIDDVDLDGENLIRELAQSFVRTKR